MWKSNMLILLISTKKLYFGEDYAIYDVILQETSYLQKWIQQGPIYWIISLLDILDRRKTDGALALALVIQRVQVAAPFDAQFIINK